MLKRIKNHIQGISSLLFISEIQKNDLSWSSLKIIGHVSRQLQQALTDNYNHSITQQAVGIMLGKGFGCAKSRFMVNL